MKFLVLIENMVRGSMKILVVSCGFAVAIGLLGDVHRFTRADAAADEAPTPSAQSIVEKAIEFHGGIKQLGRKLAMIRTEESELVYNGEKIPIKCEWQFQPPDKRAFSTSIKIGGLTLKIRMAIDGDKGWAKVGPAPASDLAPEQVAGLSWEHNNHVQSVRLLASIEEFDVGTPSPAKIDDHDAWQITFISKKQKDSVTAFFDKKTGQVDVGRLRPTSSPNAGRATSRIAFVSVRR